MPRKPRKLTIKKRVDRVKKTVTKKVRKAKKQVAKRVKTTQKTLSRATKRISKRAGKLQKQVLKKSKRLQQRASKQITRLNKVARRKVQRVKKRAVKAVKKFRAERRRQYNKRFRRSNITAESGSLGFTSDVSQTSETTAFVRAYPESKGASKPGEPPKMRTGDGRKSIKAELITNQKNAHDIKARTYVDKKIAPYMALWEYRPDGKARPFLKPSLEGNKSLFGAAIGKNLRRKLRGKL